MHKFNKGLYWIIWLILQTINSYTQTPDTLSCCRDPWLWPFAENSIWNQPIGSNAIYEPANFEDASNVGADIQHILQLNIADPLQPVLGSEGFGPGRCDGIQNLGFSIKVPDNWLVPDAGNSPWGLTPNSNFAFRLPESDTVFEGVMVSRCEIGGPVYMPWWMIYPDNRKHQNIRGSGLHGGGQGASGMSALGGTIRLGELINQEPIRHTLKINPWAQKYCYYSEEIPGYKWPAISADNYAADGYQGENPKIIMGSLFAIPPDIDINSLDLKTEPGRKLFFTLQNYGVYFTEDAAWDTWDIIVERGVEEEFEMKFGYSLHSSIWKSELNKLMKVLHIITNNNPETIGGSGIPLQPYAPSFNDDATGYMSYPKKSNTKVYPNPVMENRVLYFQEPLHVKIFNISGKLMTNSNKPVSNIFIPLDKGIYILEIKNQNVVHYEKLIVQ